MEWTTEKANAYRTSQVGETGAIGALRGSRLDFEDPSGATVANLSKDGYWQGDYCMEEVTPEK